MSVVAHRVEVTWQGLDGWQWMCRTCYAVGPRTGFVGVVADAETGMHQHIADAAVADAAAAAVGTLPEGSPARQVVEGLFAQIGVGR